MPRECDSKGKQKRPISQNIIKANTLQTFGPFAAMQVHMPRKGGSKRRVESGDEDEASSGSAGDVNGLQDELKDLLGANNTKAGLAPERPGQRQTRYVCQSFEHGV